MQEQETTGIHIHVQLTPTRIPADWRLQLTAADRQRVRFAQFYARTIAATGHAGICTHHEELLIAKLAAILDQLNRPTLAP